MKSSLDIGTAGGVLFGLASIFGSFVLEGGKVGTLILFPALVIVFGGTFATAMIGTSAREMKNVFTLMKLALFPRRHEVKDAIESLVRFSTVARKEGLLILEREMGTIETPFMRKIVRYVIDGTEPQTLRSIGETELKYVADRHARGAMIFQRMGGYSPTMGIIGTVMGLIATLASAGEDPNVLIRHIASAFIATLWGVFMANLVWLPIADKLRNMHRDEELYMDVILEGTLAIQEGNTPSVVRAKLLSMLPSSHQGAYA